jgi:ABC-type branched-subunit amino acid transport system ATPase component
MLRVEQVQAGYGAAPVLRGVSLAVGAHESVALLGANGAGKSTLVRAICGLLPLAEGRIVHDDRDLHGLPADRRVRLGIAVVLENRRLFGELTVRNHLELAAAHARRNASGERFFALDDVLALFAFMRSRLDDSVDLLSGGEQQMVAIARALLLQPKLLILDEPSTGLSPKVVRDIVAVIETLRQGGMSILLVEQNVGIAARTCERGYVMALGRIVHDIGHGEWERFREDKVLVRAYLGSEPAETTL